MLPQPVNRSASITGPTVADLMDAMNLHDAADRSALAYVMLARITSAEGISGKQAEAASFLIFSLAQIALADVAFSEMTITPANVEHVMEQVQKLFAMQRMAERQIANVSNDIAPGTVAALLTLAREQVAAIAPPSVTIH